MRAWSDARLGAAAGVFFVVLTLIGDLVAGSPPSFDDPASKIAAFYLHHHRSVLVGVILTGIAAALFVWFLSSLALAVREAGQAVLAVVVFGAGIAGVVLSIAADALTGALAQVARGGDPRFVRGAYQVAGFFVAKSYWLAALLTLAAGLAAWRALPRWYAWTSFVALPLLGLGGVAVKETGFFQPLGAMALIAFLALLIWVLATSALLWRLTPTAADASAVVASPV